MTAFKINQFGGMLPAWSDNLLPQGQAANSVNGYLFSGDLRGWRVPKKLRDLTNSAAKFAYRVPTVTSAAAVAYLVFQALPTEGDTVSVGEETYKFTATVTNAYDVLIGGTADDCAAYLLDAITIDEGAGTNAGTYYGTGTVANPDVSQVAGTCSVDYHDFGGGRLPYLKAVATDIGAAYNATPVAESTGGVRTIWLAALDALSDTTATLANGTNAAFNSDITAASSWLEFTDPDTAVMRSQVVDDQYNRYYFASPSTPPEYNTGDRIAAGQPSWRLGVPAPGCAPVVDVTGGGDGATLGNSTANNSGSATLTANYIYLLPITPDGAMQLNDISFMPNVTNTNVSFFGVVYSDNSGVPDTLLNLAAPTTGITSGTAAVTSFANPTGLLANTVYWIGIIANEDIGMVTTSDVGSVSTSSASAVYTNGPPDYAPSLSSGSPMFQLWADLTTSSVLEARSYVYTWLTEYGEEGPPSPASVDENNNPITGWSNGTWKITLWTPPDDDMGVLRNIKQLRLYRTVSATGGSTVYYLVDTLDVGTTDYTDTIDDSVVALNNQMESTNWFPPPEGLEDIKAMPNGISVGFKGNEIWFSEPYRPHAWPPGYVLTTEFPIVGLGIFGQAVVAATTGTPYIAQGVNPASMTIDKINIPEPCVSRGSVLGTESGVYYMSPNGLILVTGANQATNTTELWITREKWRALVPLKYGRAIALVSCYFCFGSTNGADTSYAQEGFTIELKQDNTSFSIWPQPGGHRVGFNSLDAPNGYNIDNVMLDPWSGVALLIQNGAIYYYDFGDSAPTMQPYKWRSGVIQPLTKKNFAVMRVYFTVPAGTPAQGTRNTAAYTDASWNTLGANQYGIVRVIADETVVMQRELWKSSEILRMPAGFKADFWQIEIEGRVAINNIQVGSSIPALAQV